MIKKLENPMIHSLKLLLVIPVLALVLMTYSCQSDSGKTDDTATEMESESGSADQENKDMAKGSESDSEGMDAADKKDMEDEVEAEAGVLTVADVMPTHPECAEGTMEDRQQCTNKVILKYVNKHLKYPDAAEEEGIQGTVVSRFVVNKQGKIMNVEIINDIGGGCGEEVERILNKMAEDETMVPGEHNGKTVSVAYTLPVKFKLG